MKTLNTYINEGGFFKNIKAEIVTPKNKQELIKIIKDTIEKEGPNCNLNFINTSKITDMSRLFETSSFDGDISGWDVHNVENMSSMFIGSKFNRDISNWDVRNVNDMHDMFASSNFNGDISKWDVSKVKSMTFMFYDSQFDGDISKWDVSKVTDIRGMFNGSKLKKLGKLPDRYN